MSISNLYGTGLPQSYGGYQTVRTQKNTGGAEKTEKLSEQTDSVKAEAAAAEAAESTQTEKTKGSTSDRETLLKQLRGGISGAFAVKVTKEYGKTVGDVKLSDEAAEYYSRLKKKFGGMDFVLVSDDAKDAVQANAAAYGAAGKTTVLINASKIEQMASDPATREKYEAILTNAQTQLGNIASAVSKNSGGDDILASFGVSVNDDGSTSYFAVFNKQQKSISDKVTQMRAAKAEEKKKTEKLQAKKDAAEKLEKQRTEKAAENRKKAEKADETGEDSRTDRAEKTTAERLSKLYDEDDYDVLTADSSEELISRIEDYFASGKGNTTGTHFSAEA